MRRFGIMVLIVAWVAIAQEDAGSATPLRFDFGEGPVAPGWVRVNPASRYSKDRGFGLEHSSPVEAVVRDADASWIGGFITSRGPFSFSVDVPEGNYRVTVYLGDPAGSSATSIKAEMRRLMVKEHKTRNGTVESQSFSINVRTPSIAGGDQVRLNEREQGHLDWDRKLTLEFLNERPCVAAVEIVPADDVVTVYLAGDSTVTDQREEPWCAWGQMLPCFFGPDVAVANHAESGRTLDSFRDQNRLKKILSTIRPGDYLLMQFGHNDMKQTGEGKGPFANFQENLRYYIAETRARGAIPVLVTPVHRRRFDDEGRIVETFGDYPEAMHQVAEEQKAALIDLHERSRILFEALGVDGSRNAFVHYPANTFPGQDKPLKDDSHFNPYGAYQLAKCVMEGIRAAHLDLVRFFKPGVPSYDPAHPDAFETWRLPASPPATLPSPEGS